MRTQHPETLMGTPAEQVLMTSFSEILIFLQDRGKVLIVNSQAFVCEADQRGMRRFAHQGRVDEPQGFGLVSAPLHHSGKIEAADTTGLHEPA